MPRDFSEESNKLTLYDNISGSKIVLYYRHPTTKETSAFLNEAVRRRRNKIEMRQAQARLKFGAKILTGFREGDFLQKKGGEKQPLSSDPESSNYTPDWKDQVVKHAADLVMLLGGYVFEGSAEVEENESDSDDFEDAEKN